MAVSAWSEVSVPGDLTPYSREGSGGVRPCGKVAALFGGGRVPAPLFQQW